jgi:succinoglycan biosynthesis protein ExoM
VVDNDAERSAEEVATAAESAGAFPVQYHVEPANGIALARNRAVLNATGDFIAFIDDDEFPVKDWLFELHRTCLEYNADAVLGPVKPEFETPPPKWIITGQLLDRPSYPTGTKLDWYNTRTGNVLLKRSLFDDRGNLFRAEFRHSEDQDFFKRILKQGYLAVWCDEAVAYEIQKAERFSVGYFVKRALLRGNVSLKLRANKLPTVAKSCVAITAYTLLLPFLGVLRQDLFILYLIKDCDHAGKMMAACGIDIQKYLT